MNIAIIPAAGSGSRLGGALPKQFIEIAGAPILIHTMRRFDVCPDIDLLCIALSPERVAPFGAEVSRNHLQKPVLCVAGGRERSETIRNALTAIDEYRPVIVAVHDAVRPFVPIELITEVIQKAQLEGAAIVAQRATDTIKEVEGGFVHQTLDRRRIYRAQTPQAFRYELLCRANDEAIAAGLDSELVTDDAMLVERLGVRVAVIDGPATNLKITTPEDLVFARSILEHAAKPDSSDHV